MSSDDSTADFARITAPYRRELLAHCYRMLGSLNEAEDLVQETYLRAWRAYGRFEGRSSIRNWLYRIATNACLTALDSSSRRAVPSGLMTSAEDPYALLAAASSDVLRVQPFPSTFVESESDDPAAIVTARDSLRLALIASLQHLPARQRAVLMLREVLAFPATEVAEMLDSTVPAVKSLLQRARAALEEAAPTADQVVEPSDPRVRELLRKYMVAFERSDAAALKKILREDVTSEAMATGSWFDGLKTCLPFLATSMPRSPGHWRLERMTGNGQSAAGTYGRSDDGSHHAYGFVVPTVTPTGISRITMRNDGVSLITTCGLPLRLGGRPH